MGLFMNIWFRGRRASARKAVKVKLRPRFQPTLESLEPRAVPTAGAFLQGTAYVDVNNNHVLDAGDTYLAGAKITLYQGTGTSIPLALAITDGNGAYLFQDSTAASLTLSDPGVVTSYGKPGLNPGQYTLVETPPPGYVNNGTQALSELNPMTGVSPSTIQTTVLDPASYNTVVFNSTNFFNRNAWDFLGQTFDFTGATVATGSSTVLMSNTNPLVAGESVTITAGSDMLSTTILSIVPNTSITLAAPWTGAPSTSATVDHDDTETAGQFPISIGAVQALGAGVTNGSPVVTVTGTSSFSVGELVNVSDTQSPASNSRAIDSTIVSIDPGVSITLANAWPGLSGNAATIVADAANPFLTLCWDLQHFLGDGTNIFAVTPVDGVGNPANAGEIAYLFNHYGTVDISTLSGTDPNTGLPQGTSAEAVGLQVAIWKLEYGSVFANLQELELANLDTNPTDLATELGNINTWASFYLSDAAGKSERATFLEVSTPLGEDLGSGNNLGQQGMIATGSGNFGNVPFATPSINTSQQPATARVGTSIADKATVSGGFNPTGTVTFLLFNNPNGTGTPLFTDTEPLSGGMATSQSYITTATGTDYWVATYNGDSNNAAVTSGPTQEPVTVTPATPSINTSQQPANAVVGSFIADKATVSGGFNPTGTVTFNLYNNPNGAGTPLFTDTEALANGMAISSSYATTAAGTVYWVATYNGDSNNNPVTSGPTQEPVTITRVMPAINTSQQPATATVGSPVADKATVSGGFGPTGTVTFKLYNNPNATGTPLFTDTESLVNGMALSRSYTTTAAGTNYWVATYNGDSNYAPVTSGTALEPVVITPATPMINTSQQPPTATVGTLIADKAFVSGGFNPTGTVSFNLYNNPNGTGTPVFADPEPLIGGVATSLGYVATATGTFYWVATYNGDSNDNPVTSGTALEPVTITAARPMVVTTATPSTTMAGTGLFKDSATVSGGFNPTGTITFTLTSPSGMVVDLETVMVSGNGTYSTPNGSVPTMAGTYVWTARYSGDANNQAATAAAEPVTSLTAPGQISKGSFLSNDPPVVPIVTATSTPAVNSSFSATAFPGNGLWRHSDSSGWQQLTPADASTVAVDDHGNVLAVFFNGLWRYEDASGWQRLTPAIPSQIAIAGYGIVVGNFPGNGMWRYGDPNAAGGGWQQLTLTDPLSIGVDDAGDTIASLPGTGTFLYQDGRGWQEMSPAVAVQVSIAASGSSAVAVFQGNGVWRYNFQGAAAGWQQLTSAFAQGMAIGPTGAVVCQFDNGVWLYQDGSGWVQLTPALASQVAITNTAEVLAEFAGGGVWEFTSSGWQQLTPADARWLGGAGG
jgi:hypothetical protein